MNDEPTLPSDRVSRALRERFLNALDADDYAALRCLSADLRNCTNMLPRSVCASLWRRRYNDRRDPAAQPDATSHRLIHA